MQIVTQKNVLMLMQSALLASWGCDSCQGLVMAPGYWASSPSFYCGISCSCLSQEKHPHVLCLQLSVRMELGIQLWPAGSFRASRGKVKIQMVTGALSLLCARVPVLPKSRASGERPVPAVVPGPVTEPGWQPASPLDKSQENCYKLPGKRLASARRREEWGKGEVARGWGD